MKRTTIVNMIAITMAIIAFFVTINICNHRIKRQQFYEAINRWELKEPELTFMINPSMTTPPPYSIFRTDTSCNCIWNTSEKSFGKAIVFIKKHKDSIWVITWEGETLFQYLAEEKK